MVGPRNKGGSFKEAPEAEELQGGRTPLMVAAAEGNLPALQFLFGRVGATVAAVDARDARGKTAAALAAMQGKSKALAMLLAAGAKPDTPASDARAPLHHAAFAGYLECTKLLPRGPFLSDPAPVSVSH